MRALLEKYSAVGGEGEEVRDRSHYKEMGREGCRGIYEKTARGERGGGEKVQKELEEGEASVIRSRAVSPLV